LLHRPDYLLQPDEVARAFEQLRQSGKVREFGVSNFRPSQVTALQRAFSRPLVTHQVQISLAYREVLDDGILDQCLSEKITPMAWSPLARGDLLLDEVPGAPKLRSVLNAVAAELCTLPAIVAVAWLLRHPASIMPVVGSVQPGRIEALSKATTCSMSRETWYRLLEAARGSRLP
jgi:predicted oxidoreductase